MRRNYDDNLSCERRLNDAEQICVIFGKTAYTLYRGMLCFGWIFLNVTPSFFLALKWFFFFFLRQNTWRIYEWFLRFLQNDSIQTLNFTNLSDNVNMTVCSIRILHINYSWQSWVELGQVKIRMNRLQSFLW